MTKETIIENCERLHAFYMGVLPVVAPIEEEAARLGRSLSGMDLIYWYSRFLDVHGCPKSGLSVLFVKNKVEFEEVKELAVFNQWDGYKEKTEDDILEPAKQFFKNNPSARPLIYPEISFNHLGYDWRVINK